jgi:hypothetical protein
MKVVVDENIPASVVDELKNKNWDVLDIRAETETRPCGAQAADSACPPLDCSFRKIASEAAKQLFFAS